MTCEPIASSMPVTSSEMLSAETSAQPPPQVPLSYAYRSTVSFFTFAATMPGRRLESSSAMSMLNGVQAPGVVMSIRLCVSLEAQVQYWSWRYNIVLPKLTPDESR